MDSKDLQSKESILLLDKIVKIFSATLKKELPADISVVEVSEEESRRLNRAYRGMDKPANVLSFLYGKEYGEIIVCPSLIRREAKAQKNSYEYQMTWMILHGMIHLSGLHHEKSGNMAQRVGRLEDHILEKIFKKKQEA